ncbi:MAG TPA: hemolysin III family protein [Chitinophagaceae bacterium]|nr:hemolysin III family protein [Chitinophagaceae bacterium]
MQTPQPDLRLKQEMVNSILHGFGILFGIISIPILITMAAKAESPDKIVGTGIYGFSFLMVFTFSTLYHGFQHEKVKRAFKILDHISIYFLIAGTYTPLLLIYHRNDFGMSLLVILWVLTFIGTIFKIFCCGKWETISTIIYLLMGWSMLSGGWSFFAEMPNNVLIMVLLGGCLYSVGVIFYVWERFFYSHAVWHICVLAAAICHYIAILLSV